MKRVYIPYWDWEEFKNGMWNTSVKNEDELLQEAIKFTGNHKDYGNAMKEVIVHWPNTMINSLTNTSINRKAFLGHCAVNYKLGIPEYITRIAWSELTEKQRIDANKEAESCIKKYENEIQNRRIHKNMGTQLLLFGDSR
jgi:hypothetical protein